MREYIAVAVLGAVLAVPSVSSAADCACKANHEDAVDTLEHFKAAFAGKVTQVEPQGEGKKVSFEVARTYKGSIKKTVSVVTTGACATEFESGKSYLVYTMGEKDAYTTDRCAPNAEIATAARAVRQLDLHTGRGGDPLKVR